MTKTELKQLIRECIKESQEDGIEEAMSAADLEAYRNRPYRYRGLSKTAIGYSSKGGVEFIPAEKFKFINFHFKTKYGPDAIQYAVIIQGDEGDPAKRRESPRYPFDSAVALLTFKKDGSLVKGAESDFWDEEPNPKGWISKAEVEAKAGILFRDPIFQKAFKNDIATQRTTR